MYNFKQPNEHMRVVICPVNGICTHYISITVANSDNLKYFEFGEPEGYRVDSVKECILKLVFRVHHNFVRWQQRENRSLCFTRKTLELDISCPISFFNLSIGRLFIAIKYKKVTK